MIVNRQNLSMGATPPTVIAAPLVRLWSYWLELRASGKLPIPLKSAIRISGLGATLPGIVISERLGPDEVVIRLAGSAVEEMVGATLTGVNLLNLTPAAQRERIARVYQQLFTAPCGFHISETLRAEGGKKFILSALVLPLAANDGDPRFTIGLYVVSRHGFEDETIKSGAVIEHRQIDTFGYIDLGFGCPES